MSIKVRLFAALREAAATSELQVEAVTLPALLDHLRDRFGEPFTTRLSVAAILVDGEAVSRDAAISLADGVEVALLPPASGGNGGGAAAARR